MKPFRPLYKTYIINHSFDEVTHYLGNLEERRHKIQADDIFGGSDSYPSPVYTFHTRLPGSYKIPGRASLKVVAEPTQEKTTLQVTVVPNYFFVLIFLLGIFLFFLPTVSDNSDVTILQRTGISLLFAGIAIGGDNLGKNILLGTFERCLYDFQKQQLMHAGSGNNK